MKYVVILLTAATQACVRAAPPGPPAPHNATNVGASFGRTWDAVIDQFARRTIPIKTIERASGLIATDELKVDSTYIQYVDCGRAFGGALYIPTDATFNVLVRGDSTRSTVLVTVRWMSIARDGRSSAICSSLGTWETGFESTVKQTAESHR